MREFVNENRGDEVSGSTTGVVHEWQIHNIANDVGNALTQVGTALNDENLLAAGSYFTEKADPLDFGSTIFDDSHGFPSYLMWGSYLATHPISFAYDLYIHLTE